MANRRRPVSRTLAALYPPLPRISVDYAVMEKARNILVASGDFGWDDVGTWSSADRHLATDARHNVLKGDVAVLDVSDTVAIADAGAPKIAVLGVKDLVIVATAHSVLVADKSRVQDLKKMLAVMAKGRAEG